MLLCMNLPAIMLLIKTKVIAIEQRYMQLINFTKVVPTIYNNEICIP